MTITLTGYLRSKFEWIYTDADDLGSTTEDEEKSIVKTIAVDMVRFQPCRWI